MTATIGMEDGMGGGDFGGEFGAGGSGIGDIPFDDGLPDDGTIAYVTVEFDHDGDGVADGTTVTGASNQFVYAPAGLSYGTHTIRARALEWDYEFGTYLYGPWSTFTFTWGANPAPAVASLELQNDNGTYDNDKVTSDASLVGQLVAMPEEVLSVKIEIDVNADGTSDAVVWTDSEGSFTYTPQGLAAAAVTVQARSVRYDAVIDANVMSAWKSLAFTYQSPTPPSIDTLGLLVDSGEDDSDLITSITTLVGELASSGSDLSDVDIQFDHDGDGSPDGTVMAQYDGQFLYEPIGLSEGQHTILARASIWDANLQQPAVGSWSALTFTFQAPPNALVTVEDLRLFNDTGDNDADLLTSDPTLTGLVANDGSVDRLKVEFDHDGDGTPDG
ncbi:MAG: hypothetical protein HYV60_01820, partial [Planctomycetia bacterium]|nr:hypothetical protein [Planctomycetia bacterium]